MIPPKLAWVPTLQTLVNHATEGDLVTWRIEEQADPLKKLVVFQLSKDWVPKNFKPFQTLAHAFAQANDCVLERIRARPGALVLEVLIKRRFGPKMQKNPLR